MAYFISFRHVSGRKRIINVDGFWQPPTTFDDADPQIPHLPLLDASNVITPTSIASTEAFGTAVVAGPIIAIGIASTEAFGTHSVTTTGTPQTITATGMASEETFGAHAVYDLATTIFPDGIVSEEAFGTLRIQIGDILPDGIDDGNLFGTATLSLDLGAIQPAGIVSGEVIGSHAVAQSAGLVLVLGIPSAETFGTPTVSRGVAMATGWDTLGSLGAGQPFGLLPPQDLEPFPNMMHIDFNSLTFRRWFEKLAIRVRQQNQLHADQIQQLTLNIANFGSALHSDLDGVQGEGVVGADQVHWTRQEILDNAVRHWIAIDT